MGVIKRGNYKPKKENVSKLEVFMKQLPDEHPIKKIVKEKIK